MTPKVGEVISIIDWVDPHPKTKSLTLKVEKIFPAHSVDGTTWYAGSYVKYRTNGEVKVGVGRLNLDQVSKWELVDVEEFDKEWTRFYVP